MATTAHERFAAGGGKETRKETVFWIFLEKSE
jgi:hypothetical protein